MEPARGGRIPRQRAVDPRV